MSQVNESFFKKHDDEGGSRRILKSWNLKLVGFLAITWSLFQLWYASPLPFLLDFGKLIDVPARAIHLAFGMGLCFLAYPAFKSKKNSSINIFDFIFALASIFATSIARDDGLMVRIEQKAQQLLAKARNLDSQQQTSRRLSTRRFINDRRS